MDGQRVKLISGEDREQGVGRREAKGETKMEVVARCGRETCSRGQ
jgi:hypothetical protein